MNLTQLCAVLKSTGLPVTERAWPAGKAPELPWIAYLVVGSSNLAADGIVFFLGLNVRVELYLKTLDETVCGKVEAAFDAAEIFWEKDVDAAEEREGLNNSGVFNDRIS